MKLLALSFVLAVAVQAHAQQPATPAGAQEQKPPPAAQEQKPPAAPYKPDFVIPKPDGPTGAGSPQPSQAAATVGAA